MPKLGVGGISLPQLNRHEQVVKETVVPKHLVVGTIAYTCAGLVTQREKDEMLDINVVGTVSFAKDVEPDLACDVVQLPTLYSVLRASPAVRDALADRRR